MGRKSKAPSSTSKSSSTGGSANEGAGGVGGTGGGQQQQQQQRAQTVNPVRNTTARSITEWIMKDYQGPLWIFGCMMIGAALGFAIGAGWFSGGGSQVAVRPWKQSLANKIRSTYTYQFFTFQGKIWDDWLDRFAEWAEEVEKDIEAEEYAKNPSHPRVFAVLREAVVREKGGYVHPDLGFLVPAPSGAARGIGMVRNAYHSCQVNCMPGLAQEKMNLDGESANETSSSDATQYRQEEVLIRVPLNFQITRSVALETLTSIIPSEVQKKFSLHELDDAALLLLFLANERGVGRYSRWMPYIASMPPHPSCGYSEELRPHMLDSINALRDEVGVDVQGWPAELEKATQYAQKIASGLNGDYGKYLKNPEGVSSYDSIRWALCQVGTKHHIFTIYIVIMN